jgi:hypothetical protein
MTPEMKGFLLLTVVKLLAIFTFTLIGVAYLTLVERKLCAWMQYRLGPNRVGPNGWFQPLADGLKNILKEETVPPRRQQDPLRPGAGIVPDSRHHDVAGPALGRAAAGGLRLLSAASGPLRASRAYAHCGRRSTDRFPLRDRHRLDGGLRYRLGRLVLPTTSTAC